MLPRQAVSPSSSAAMQRRIARNPALRHKLAQMRLNLSPLVQITTGQVHPDFPRTVLQFWLLTDAQLESLADFYHQRRPSDLTYCYPCPVVWDSSLPLEAKRRKIGSFIGLRGCCDPSATTAAAVMASSSTTAAATSSAAVHLKSENDIAHEARFAARHDLARPKLAYWHHRSDL